MYLPLSIDPISVLCKFVISILRDFVRQFSEQGCRDRGDRGPWPSLLPNWTGFRKNHCFVRKFSDLSCGYFSNTKQHKLLGLKYLS